jgi:NADH-quinone oxidoreductase subunit A
MEGNFSLKDPEMNFDLIESVFPIILALVLAMAIPALMMGIAALLGPQRPNAVKLSPYECGIQSPAISGDARHRYNVKFYLIAMCFLVFDVEVVFLLPWAVLFQKMAWNGFFYMIAFLGILVFGWFYLLKRGALEWE